MSTKSNTGYKKINNQTAHKVNHYYNTLKAHKINFYLQKYVTNFVEQSPSWLCHYISI